MLSVMNMPEPLPTEIVATLEIAYGDQYLPQMKRDLAEFRSRSTSAENLALLSMFDGFIALAESRYADVMSIMSKARADLLVVGRLHEAARCAMALGRATYLSEHEGEALRYWDIALAEFEQVGDVARMSRVLSWETMAYVQLGDLTRAEALVGRSLDVATQTGDKLSLAEAWNTRGNMALDTNNLAGALEALERARDLFLQIGRQSNADACTANIGLVYQNQGDHPRTIELLSELIERDALPQERDTTYNTIGNAYMTAGDLAKAYEYFRRCLDVTQSIRLRAYCLNNIGNVLQALGENVEALGYYRHAVEVGNTVDVRTADRMHMSVAVQHVRNGSYADALVELDHLEHILDPDFDAFLLMICKRLRAQVALERGDTNSANRIVEEIGDYFADTYRIEEHLQVIEMRAKLIDDVQESVRMLAAAAAAAREQSLVHTQLDLLATLRNKHEQLADYRSALRTADEHHTLERTVFSQNQAKRRAMIDADHRMSEERVLAEQQRNLLHSMLPPAIVERLVGGEPVNDLFEETSVIFLDIVGFTELSSTLKASEVVALLDTVFRAFDEVCKRHSITKIKTIGDSYMAVAGLPEPLTDHAHSAAQAALEMMQALHALPANLQARIGIHCGPVTAGVIGTDRLQYDVWGDTVNVASRLESTSEPGRVHVSEAFACSLTNLTPLTLERGGAEGAGVRLPGGAESAGVRSRGQIELKGKGTMATYWLERTQ
jgi:class 3 adenylate cyclase